MPPDDDDVRSELERVLASPLFANAGRLSRLLRFTVERTLDGEGDRLKEYLLGVEVFDRDERYDPRLDSIVRVEARRLRARLTEYYSSVGREDPIVIRYEKGGYAPQFERRAPAGDAADVDRKTVTTPADAVPLPQAHRQRTRLRWIAAAGVAGVLLIAPWMLRTAPRTDAAGARPQTPTLAVLPLAHFSEDAAEDALGDRLTDGIITELGRMPSLRVISRTSVMQYKGTRRPLREVAAALTATVIFEGSVLRDAGRVQVKARLVDATTDTKFWADIFQSEPDQLFDLQRRIAVAVAGAMERRARGER